MKKVAKLDKKHYLCTTEVLQVAISHAEASYHTAQ